MLEVQQTSQDWPSKRSPQVLIISCLVGMSIIHQASRLHGCFSADGRPTLSASGVQRVTNHLSKCGAYIAHCQPQSVEVHVGSPDRPGSEQQQLQTVQEPVLVLTTTHLLVLQQGLQPVVLIQLPGMTHSVGSGLCYVQPSSLSKAVSDAANHRSQ